MKPVLPPAQRRLPGRRLVTALAIAGLLGGFAGQAAAADPTIWSVADGGNGHAYVYVDDYLEWSSARQAALDSSFAGVHGHLANVTSAEENDFLGSLHGDGWLGGSDAAQEGVWRWTDGAEAGQQFWSGGPGGQATGYAAWESIQPDNLNGENYLDRHNGQWNDLAGWRSLGYFVEYDLRANTSPVPEPGYPVLLGAGLLMVAALRRKQTRAVRA